MFVEFCCGHRFSVPHKASFRSIAVLTAWLEGKIFSMINIGELKTMGFLS
jgi:hypothetical protein